MLNCVKCQWYLVTEHPQIKMCQVVISGIYFFLPVIQLELKQLFDGMKHSVRSHQDGSDWATQINDVGINFTWQLWKIKILFHLYPRKLFPLRPPPRKWWCRRRISLADSTITTSNTRQVFFFPWQSLAKLECKFLGQSVGDDQYQSSPFG